MHQSITFLGKRSTLKGINLLLLRKALNALVSDHRFSLKKIRYVMVDDEAILDINKTYLKHDYYTDIITFDLSEEKGPIEAEIYISYETVASNAIKYKEPFEDELARVIFHGALHLVGYKDKTPSDQKEMRRMEEHCLTLYRKSVAGSSR